MEIMEISEIFILLAICLTGVVIGTMGGLFGNGHFLSIPLWQIFFPGMSFAQIIGTGKCGGFMRGLGTALSTYKQIDISHNFALSIPFLMGTFLGATFIAHLDQKMMFFALLFAIFLAEFSPYFSTYINTYNKLIFAFFIGIYNGFLGAGIGIMILALIRTSFPEDHQIMYAKIQARFIEFIATIIAIGAHIIHDTIIWKFAISWGIGAFIGGIISGKILNKWGKMSGKSQKIILWISFLFALIASGITTFT